MKNNLKTNHRVFFFNFSLFVTRGIKLLQPRNFMGNIETNFVKLVVRRRDKVVQIMFRAAMTSSTG
jgi:hypothetical protein